MRDSAAAGIAPSRITARKHCIARMSMPDPPPPSSHAIITYGNIGNKYLIIGKNRCIMNTALQEMISMRALLSTLLTLALLCAGIGLAETDGEQEEEALKM